MFYLSAFLALSALLAASPVVATPLSNDILDKEYIGNPDEASASRKAYCACTRDRLASLFNLEGYAQFSEKAAKGKAPEDGMAKLQALANDCIEKTLK